jgi:glycosyltransferase involved in cell wall biosynthesis
VRAIESQLVTGATFVSTVCDSIASAMSRAYHLDRKPLVIRNVPALVESAFRAPAERMVVLYHGILMPNRGLEELIRSVRLWHPGLRLVLRGFGRPAYERRLRALVEGSGVADRVTFAPAVPPEQLVPLANDADIGFFAQPIRNHQTRFALPNKLFEYIMAGLAVCVSDAPEMAGIVHQYKVGETCSSTTPSVMAGVLNSLTPRAVATYKLASLEAAGHLNWEQESRVLTDAYRELGASRAASAA